MNPKTRQHYLFNGVQMCLLLLFLGAVLALGGVHLETRIVMHVMIVVAMFAVCWIPLHHASSMRRLLGMYALGLAYLGLQWSPSSLGSYWPADVAASVPFWTLLCGPLLLVGALSARLLDPRVFRTFVLILGGCVSLVFIMHLALDTTGAFRRLFPVQTTEGLAPPFVNANHTATLVIWLCSCLWYVQAHTPWHQWLRGGLLLILGVLFVYCGSVGAVIVASLLIWLQITVHRSGWVRWGGVGAGSAVFAALIPTILSKTQSSWESDSFFMRLQIWEDSVAFLPNVLPMGSGWGTYERAYAAWGTHGFGTVSHAHFEPLQFLIEGGVVAGVGLVIFLMWFFRLEGNTRGVFRGVWLGTAGILFHSIVDFQLHIPALVLLFGGSCVLLYEQSSVGKEAALPVPRWVLGCVVAVQLVGGGLALCEWRVTQAEEALRADLSVTERTQWLETMAKWDVWGQTYAVAQVRETVRNEGTELARRRAIEAVEAFPHHGEVLTTAGYALMRTGFLDEARDIVERALRWQPNDYRTRALHSIVAQQQNKLDLAEQAWGEALAVWPPNATSQPVRQALQLNPIGLLWLAPLRGAHPKWSERLGDEMMRVDDFETAVLAYEQVFAGRTMQWDIPQYGLALVRTGQVEKGLSELARMSRQYPNAPWVVRQEALAFTALGRFEDAAQVWTRVADLGQGDEALQKCLDVLDQALLKAKSEELRRLRQKRARCEALCSRCN